MVFCLFDFDVDFKIGKFNVIIGFMGCGKILLLMVLFGEMIIMNGCVFFFGGCSCEDVCLDFEIGFVEICVYVVQQVWFVNVSIKENIFFFVLFDEERYCDVIVVCVLEYDLEIFDNGDEILVGEKGIIFLGGQKQCILFVCVVYLNLKYLFLDDCLSVVDFYIVQWIFINCIMGFLMVYCICIFVLYNIFFCVLFVDFVLIMSNGCVIGQGIFKELIEVGKFGEDVIFKFIVGFVYVFCVFFCVLFSVGEESGDILFNEVDRSL